MSTIKTTIAKIFQVPEGTTVATLPWTGEFVNTYELPPTVVRTDIETLVRFASYSSDPTDRALLLEELVLFILNDGLPPKDTPRSFYLKTGTLTYIVLGGLFQVLIETPAAELVGAFRHTLPMHPVAETDIDGWVVSPIDRDAVCEAVTLKFSDPTRIEFVDKKLTNFFDPAHVRRIKREGFRFLKENPTLSVRFCGESSSGAFGFSDGETISIIVCESRFARGIHENAKETLHTISANAVLSEKIQNASLSGTYHPPQASPTYWTATRLTPEEADKLIESRFADSSKVGSIDKNLTDFTDLREIDKIKAESIVHLKADPTIGLVYSGFSGTGAYAFVEDQMVVVVTAVNEKLSNGPHVITRYATPTYTAFAEQDFTQPAFRMADLVRHTGPRNQPLVHQTDEPVVFPWNVAVRLLHLHLVSELVRYENMSPTKAQAFIIDHYEAPDAGGLMRKHMESILQKGTPLLRPRGQW